jgi:hypothetical protein
MITVVTAVTVTGIWIIIERENIGKSRVRLLELDMLNIFDRELFILPAFWLLNAKRNLLGIDAFSYMCCVRCYTDETIISIELYDNEKHDQNNTLRQLLWTLNGLLIFILYAKDLSSHNRATDYASDRKCSR